VLAPTGRDAGVTAQVLADSGFWPQICPDIETLCLALDGSHDVGAILVAEEALDARARSRLVDAITAQPPWSDVPVIVLTGEGELSGAPSRALADLSERANLTLLERPVRRATLLTTLRSALRARRRQFELRDHLAQRAEHERQLMEARKLAEVGSEAKTRFLATMSHELRTPLNAIAGYTDLMAMELHGPITPEQRADLQRIERSQRYLLSLINDILNFAKIEAGQVSFAARSFLIDPLLRELDAFVAPQIAAKGVRYSYESAGDQCSALADEEKVQQILLNLLSNAVKFTPPRGSIHVACAANGDHVLITVRDSGTGVPEAKREAIFEPFVQLDRGLTSTAQGTGLGLSISRDLARRMGGDLTVDDSPGGGARFTLVLPRG
jgi:signal transduction histidine kinase